MYITHLCLVSRENADSLVINNIKHNLVDDYENEVVLIVDNIKINRLKYQIALEKLPLRNITIISTGNKAPSFFTMTQRRNRVAAAHNLAKEHIGASQFVFGFEDDTVLEPNSLQRLLIDYSFLNEQNDVGFIQGVEVSRWGRPFVGAWLIDDFKNPELYKTLLPLDHTIEEIDAGGLYCFLTTTDLYKKHDFKWEEPCGPDVYFGRQLRLKGHQNFIDWSIKCGHKTTNGLLKLDRNSKELEIYQKNGRWHHKTIDGVNA